MNPWYVRDTSKNHFICTNFKKYGSYLKNFRTWNMNFFYDETKVLRPHIPYQILVKSANYKIKSCDTTNTYLSGKVSLMSSSSFNFNVDSSWIHDKCPTTCFLFLFQFLTSKSNYCNKSAQLINICFASFLSIKYLRFSW